MGKAVLHDSTSQKCEVRRLVGDNFSHLGTSLPNYRYFLNFPLQIPRHSHNPFNDEDPATINLLTNPPQEEGTLNNATQTATAVFTGTSSL
jgi:hypothetical protein